MSPSREYKSSMGLNNEDLEKPDSQTNNSNKKKRTRHDDNEIFNNLLLSKRLKESLNDLNGTQKYKKLKESFNSLRDQGISTRKEALSTISESQDDKVRLLYHLDNFISLTEYDPLVAKQEKTNAFLEYKKPYNLWNDGNITTPTINMDKNMTNQTDTNETPKRKGKRISKKAENALSFLEQTNTSSVHGTPVRNFHAMSEMSAENGKPAIDMLLPNNLVTLKDKISLVDEIPIRDKLPILNETNSGDDLPFMNDGLFSDEIPPGNFNESSNGSVQTKRSESLSFIDTNIGESTNKNNHDLNSFNFLYDSHSGSDLDENFVQNYYKDIDYQESSTDMTLPKIKIKYNVPSPIITHPFHIVEPATYGNNIKKYLDSFISYDNDDVLIDTHKARVLKDAEVRKRIEDLGIFDLIANSSDPHPAAYKKPFVPPPQPPTHNDYLISHALHFSKLLNEERKLHISRAKKISSMIQSHFKRLNSASEKEQKLEEKRIRRLAKWTANEVKKKWKIAYRVALHKQDVLIKEQKRIEGKEQLDKILQHSTQLLESQMDTTKDDNKNDKVENQLIHEPSKNNLNTNRISSNEKFETIKSDSNTRIDTDMTSEIESLETENSNSVTNLHNDTIDEKVDNSELYNSFEHNNSSNQLIQKDHILPFHDKENSPTENNFNIEKSVDNSTKAHIADRSKQIQVPFLLKGSLRPYQKAGLDWLVGLYKSNTNGILADEMGLGKTIQTIALISYLACFENNWGPHLIVVPTSVMLNWEMEFKRFAPGLKIMTYYGSPAQRREKRKGWNKENIWHVCITSYQLVLHDQVVFRRKKWQYMVLDEAHNIKNFRSQRWQALLNFRTKHRLLLTGTPLQNNLIELWSLLYFLMPASNSNEDLPGGFADLANFQEWFSKPVDKLIEGEGQDDESRSIITKLHRVLRPYLLRRIKADVEKQMPAKYEHVVFCRLSKRQRNLYDEFMSRAKTKETLASGNYLSIINCLMQLRKVCNHPDLFEVRPIVTSYAMKDSIPETYQPKDLLKQRKLLQLTDETNELSFLNLVPAHASGSQLASNRVKTLDATDKIKKLADSFMISDESDKEFDTKTISGMCKLLKKNTSIYELSHLSHIAYVNNMRAQQFPIYGIDLIQNVKADCGLKMKDFSIQNSFPFFASIDQCAQKVDPIIEKFACVTPNVVTPGMYELFSTPKLNSLLSMSSSFNLDAPFHNSRVKLSIAFPDKHLLQYDCGKLQKLSSLLDELIPAGHRVLIFTQMTKMLDILERFLNLHGLRYMRLDGSTKIEQRQLLTERFNNDPRISVFILSSRSGGLGINLTGADTVVFYDSDWNPSMDKQCQDRCHRIGQTRDVHIYRLVSEYTIESNILKKARQKTMLDNVVIQEGDFTTDYLSKVSIKDMLGETAVDNLNLDKLDSSNFAKSISQVEDNDDVIAAKEAMKEIEVDEEDFTDNNNSNNNDNNNNKNNNGSVFNDLNENTDIDISLTKKSGSPSRDMDLDEKGTDVITNNTGDLNDTEASIINDESHSIHEMYYDFGSIDEYMIKFVEDGYYANT